MENNIYDYDEEGEINEDRKKKRKKRNIADMMFFGH